MNNNKFDDPINKLDLFIKIKDKFIPIAKYDENDGNIYFAKIGKDFLKISGKTKKYFCPIFNKEIAEGLCIEINLGVLSVLKEVFEETGKEKSEISNICDTCPNYPL